MNTDILSIDAITIIEEMPEERATLLVNEAGNIEAETPPLTTRFGSIDLWKIRRARKNFTFYR